MKILKIIHGYPPAYNAGSEVYSQNLCQALAEKGHDVAVFTRFEDILKPDCFYEKSHDRDDPRIVLHSVNLPRERNLLTYHHPGMDQVFSRVFKAFAPDIVHIGHLNHLSLGIVNHVFQAGTPIIYTLHDYWLMCLRGQFLQRNSTAPFALCSGQRDEKCATHCLQGMTSTAHDQGLETQYWGQWVQQRTRAMRDVCEKAHLLVAPARYLESRFCAEFHIPPEKITYLDYGFNRRYLKNRQRTPGEPFTFGYIGTHIPAKGISHLIQAFAQIPDSIPTQLRLWGRQTSLTPLLQQQVEALPVATAHRISWMGEYTNSHIVGDVFNHVDAIVVPSIWPENSPLVIHEAQELRVPVITANMGGMSEYVRHEVNGLLFHPRDVADLAAQMTRLAQNPARAKQLGNRGYLFSTNGRIPDIQEHASVLENIYLEAQS